MGKRKTADDYAEDVAEFHHQLQDDPENASLKIKLEYRIKKWMSLIDIKIEVAQNEQKEWTSDMLGYPTIPMRTKNMTGYDQTADYAGVVNTPDGEWYVPTICERKSIEDLYGTLIDETNRDRFYREIDRYKADSRFTSMVIIVEGTLTDFLIYQPEFKGNEFDYTRRFDTKKNSIINDKKLTVLSDLLIMGIPVIFCDNPTLAAKFCGRLFRESVRKNYWRLLGLPMSQLPRPKGSELTE